MSQRAETKPVLFLDSTVQVSRVLGSAERRRIIERDLVQRAQACTAVYVWMEHQRTVVSDFAHVHRVLLNESEWGTVVARVATGQRSFRPRSLGRVNRILGETLNRSRLDREKGLLFLATYLEHKLAHLFWRNVTPLPDPICCDLVKSGIQRQPDGTYIVADTCRKQDAACQLPEFLASQRPALRTLTEYLDSRPNVIKNQPRVEQLLTAIQFDPQAALGQAACWSLGDIIIALQAPPDAAIWSLDSDFEPLAEALGVQLHQAS